MGSTIEAIEHDPDANKTADWVMDLGPMGEPGAHAYSAAFKGHIATIARRKRRKIVEEEPHSHFRCGKGKCLPVINAAIEQMIITGVTGITNCPGSTRKCGPYGR